MSEFIEINDLGITFGGLKAVDSFSAQIRKNELYGLIGPNGAGKTTVFNLLTGVYKPDKGSFILDGVNLTGKSTTEICKGGVARTFQNIRLFHNLSVRDNVKVAMQDHYPYSLVDSFLHTPKMRRLENEMDEAAEEILKVFGLAPLSGFLASQLPYGQQRMLEIARALATRPRFLLLDEPAAGMNPQETGELMDTIRFVRDKFDMTILLIEHDMKLVSGICDRLSVLNFGSLLCQGETKDVLNDPAVIKAYLGD